MQQLIHNPMQQLIHMVFNFLELRRKFSEFKIPL